MLDFECAMTRDRAYEFVAADLFVSRSDPRLAYTLLHVHSNLPECLAELPAPPEPTLDSLAVPWFGTA
jgi:hygromycin-B 7''-O-kinase